MKLRFLTDEGSLFRPSHPDDWVERHAGLVIALAVGIGAWVLLATTPLTISIPEPEIPMKIVLKPAVPEPEPEIAPEELQPAEVAATTVTPVEEAPLEVAMLMEDTPLEEVDDSPRSLVDWAPRTEAERQAFQSMVSKVADARDRLEKRQTDLEGQVDRIAIEAAGREFLLNSDGGREGIIRTLDTSGFPDDIVIPLFARYGITVEYRNVRPQGNRKFLNSATTSEGTFTNVEREGYYEVFVMSTKAVSMMASMETTALMERGYDPIHSRIRKVVFGIIKDEMDEYSLGVTDIEIERIR
ncbi:hypothetical protein KQI84_11755 [bacterium]|nr:hypothetical protein [bacterium]